MKNINCFLFLIIVIIATSCVSNEECQKERSVNLEIGFFEKKLNPLTNTYTFPAISIDSLTVRGITSDGKLIDSILYNNSKKISEVNLPLNKLDVQSKYKVTFNKTVDTITVIHTSTTNQFLSLECGCIKTFSIDTVLTTNHFIDSVKIDNHTVNTLKLSNAQHIRIFN